MIYHKIKFPSTKIGGKKLNKKLTVLKKTGSTLSIDKNISTLNWYYGSNILP